MKRVLGRGACQRGVGVPRRCGVPSGAHRCEHMGLLDECHSAYCDSAPCATAATAKLTARPLALLPGRRTPQVWGGVRPRRVMRRLSGTLRASCRRSMRDLSRARFDTPALYSFYRGVLRRPYLTYGREAVYGSAASASPATNVEIVERRRARDQAAAEARAASCSQDPATRPLALKGWRKEQGLMSMIDMWDTPGLGAKATPWPYTDGGPDRPIDIWKDVDIPKVCWTEFLDETGESEDTY